MKKYINGKKYDTETAVKVGYFELNNDYSSFSWYDETLYRKKTGEFFIYGTGNAASPYSESRGSNRHGSGSRIKPLTFDEAREWAEENLTGEEYEQIFGEIEDDGTDVLISAIIKASSRDKLRRAAEKTGKTIGQIINELIEEGIK